MNSVAFVVSVVVMSRRLSLGVGLLLSMVLGNAVAADFLYTVQRGDHPWNLAQRYLKNPTLGPRLLRINGVPDDRRVMPGTKLRIPHDWLQLRTAQVRLVAVYGETSLVRGKEDIRAAVAGDLLQAPVTLRTGSTGSATLGFADGSRVLVRSETELQVKKAQQRELSEASLVELLLLHGGLENQVTPLGDSGGRFEIRTPAAVAAVRGTQFRVDARGAALRTEVLSGVVNVANARGQVNAAAGRGSVAQSSQLPPGPPTALLEAPRLDALPERIERLPIDWPLPALAGATAYRTQMALDADFSLLLSDESSPAARIRARDVEDGNYVLRVRGIDAQGLEGFSAQRALVVHARPAPPLLIEPTPQAVTDATRPNFRWTQADASWRYRLQILDGNSTNAVTTPLHEQVVIAGANAQFPQELAPGLYQWRVAAIHPEKGQGPWGDAQGFRRVLPGPAVQSPQLKDGTLTLSWSRQPEVAQYRLQVARDGGFASPLVDLPTEDPQHSLKDLQPGVHHVRVQTLGVDGYTGPWGSTQTFTVPEPAPQHWRALLLLLPLMVVL